MQFYGVMTAVYALYAIIWLISLGLNYTDLVRLQFWVLGVIILGFLEKALFLAEYDQSNQGNNSQSTTFLNLNKYYRVLTCFDKIIYYYNVDKDQ